MERQQRARVEEEREAATVVESAPTSMPSENASDDARHASVASLLDALDGLDLDAIQPAGRRDGDLSRPRRYEVAAALNRLRTAKFEIIEKKRGRDVMDET